MSGHSKWSKIHRQKGVADAKRGAIFTRLGKAVTIAAREGGGNPESNFKLRLAMDQARAGNMPKENIERAIKRGTGELKGDQIDEIIYEGFGPDGVAIIIEALTDNRNRTSSEIKHILSKNGGSLGAPNSVMWMFKKKGIIRIKSINDDLELELIDAGAADIVEEEGGVTIYCEAHNLQKIKSLLEEKNIEVEFADVNLIAKEKKEIDDKIKGKLERLYETLEESEDVSNYYSNAEI